MSAGSYATFDAGGRGYSVDPLDGDHCDRVGECDERDEGLNWLYGGELRCTGCMSGALSRIDGSLDTGRELLEGWYEGAGEVGRIGRVYGFMASPSLPSSLLLNRTLTGLLRGLFLDSELSTSCNREFTSMSPGGSGVTSRI